MTLRSRAVAVALCCAAAAAAPAAAAARPPKPPTTAKGWYEKGSTHHKVGEFDLAIAAYKEAYKLDHKPIHLYNIALACAEAGRLAEAVRSYELYLADDSDSPLRAEVEAQLARLRPLLAAAAAPPPASGPATGPATLLPASAPASAPHTLPALIVHTKPLVPEGYESGKRRGLVLGLGVGAAALVAGAAAVVVVLVLRGSAVDRYLADYSGDIIDLRP
jgi:tetratricopeptide (TPR) repeat protein